MNCSETWFLTTFAWEDKLFLLRIKNLYLYSYTAYKPNDEMINSAY